MRTKIRRVVAVVGLVIGVMTLVQAAPASAHDGAEWGGDSCLHYLHGSYIGSITYKTYSNGTTTCDGDNNYNGKVRDDHATSDGYCVRAVLDNVLMTTSCSSSGSNFQFTDPQQDWYAWTCMTETSGDYLCTDNWNF
jgi:hypothetical protein